MEELSILRLAPRKSETQSAKTTLVSKVTRFLNQWMTPAGQLKSLVALTFFSAAILLVESRLSALAITSFVLLLVCLRILYKLATLFIQQREQVLQFEDTIEAITDIYWQWDLETGAFEYSGKMAELLGYDDRKPTDGFWKEIIHPEDRALQKYQLLRHMADETQPYYCEYRFLDCNQEYQWFAGRGKVVSRDRDQQPILMVGSIEHIQPRKDMEQTLMRAHRMEALGQLTGGIAHDFNNILGTVLGYAELSVESDSPRKLQEYAQHILTAGGRARDVVRQLLDFSRNSGGEELIVNVADEIDSALIMARSTLPSAIQITKALPDYPCYSTLDPTQLQRVLLNLCINARDAMGGRGSLTIVLHTQHIGLAANSKNMEERQLEQPHPLQANGHSICETPLVCSSCQQPFSGEFQKLSITDDGCGFDQDIQDRLFEPFFTTKAFGEGTGMGLSVVHGIIHEYGGHITIESQPGNGTNISLFLPATLKSMYEASLSDPISVARG